AVFAILEEARYVQRGDPLGRLGGDLSLEEDEITGSVGEALLDLGLGHLEQRREARELPPAGMRLTRDRPDRPHRRADGERLAVAVQNAAAVRRNLHHAAVARFALRLQEIVVQALEVDRAAEQQPESCDENVQKEA